MIGVSELIELYSIVYGVSRPKLQFLGYSDIRSDLVNTTNVISFPKMSWFSFKRNYYNSVLYFFNEKAVGCISVNGSVVSRFVSSEFIHLYSIIYSLVKEVIIGDNDNVEVFFLTGELFADVSFHSEKGIFQDTLFIQDSTNIKYSGTIDSNRLQNKVSKVKRDTPVLLIQFDNSVKMW